MPEKAVVPTIEERMRNVLTAQLGIGLGRITPNIHLVDDLEEILGILGIEMSAIVIAFEKEFGIRISDEDAKGFHTVQDIIALLKRQGIQDRSV